MAVNNLDQVISLQHIDIYIAAKGGLSNVDQVHNIYIYIHNVESQ